MIIVVALVVVTAGAFYYQGKQVPVYESSVSLGLSSELQDTAEQSAAAPVDFSARAAIADPVLQAAAHSSGIAVNTLRSGTNASVDSNTGDLTIAVTASDPNESKIAAAAVASAFVDSLQTSINNYKGDLTEQLGTLAKTIQQLQSKLPVPTKAIPDPPTDALLQAQIDNAVSTYTDVSSKIDRIDGLGTPAIVSAPAAAGNLTSPSPKMIIAIGALAGLLAGIGLALIWYFMNPRVRTPDDLETGPDSPVLAQIPGYRDRSAPEDSGLAVVEAPDAPFTEAIRVLRTDIAARLADRGASIVIASPGAGEGRSFIAANLAASFALSGRRTALVFGDVRHNGLEPYFGDGTEQGAEHGAHAKRVLSRFPGGPELEESEIENLYLVRNLVSVQPGADALAQESTRKSLLDIAGKADVVIVDSPALSDYADAAVLGGYCDGVIMVARRGRTRPAAVQAALGRIKAAGGRPYGVVLNVGR